MSLAEQCPPPLAVFVRPASRVVVFLGRCGFVARGLIYLTMGILAGLAALGDPHGEATDPQGAVSRIDELPFGTPLLILAGLGLAGYAFWRLVQAIFNLEEFRGGSHGWRVLFVLDGLFHAGFAAMVFSVVRGTRRGDGEAMADHWTAEILRHPAGMWLVGVGGLVAIGYGAYVLYRAFTIRHRDYLQRRIQHTWQSALVVMASRVGEPARAVVCVIIGTFLVRAAWTLDPHETIGPAGALQALAHQPGGRVWLGLIALGFIAYGALSALEARYRKIGHGGFRSADD